jgi:hypothetical protein
MVVTGTGRLVRIEGKMIGEKNIEILDIKPVPEHSGPQTSNRTTTLSTQPRQCRSGFGTSI